MSTTYLELTASDPIVARDGRPFGVGQGVRMKGLGWPYPSVVAGSFRTALVKATGGDFSGDTPARLLKLAVAGVFPVANEDLYLPAPSDCVIHPQKGPLRAYPQDFDGGGCDLPAEGLRPVMLSFGDSEKEFKPVAGPAWWPRSKYVRWLTGAGADASFFDDSFLLAPKPEDRTQIEMNADVGAAEEGRLFTTAGLRLAHLPRFNVSLEEARFEKRFAPVTLAARVEGGGWDASKLNNLHPLGGERRLVHWAAKPHAALWKCPGDVTTALGRANKVRMALATPAVFRHGWRPGWLNENLEGSPPGSSVRLKLVGVSASRWKAVSGWSLAAPRGPKPVKRLVPAGGVYFFETVGSAGAAPLAELWLRPVSDDEQDRNDGFGLAVWGTWGNETGGAA